MHGTSQEFHTPFMDLCIIRGLQLNYTRWHNSNIVCQKRLVVWYYVSKELSKYQPVPWGYIANMLLLRMRIIFASCHDIIYFGKIIYALFILPYFTLCFILVVRVPCHLHLITPTIRRTYPINHKCSPWRTNMVIGSTEWRLFQPKQCKQHT